MNGSVKTTWRQLSVAIGVALLTACVPSVAPPEGAAGDAPLGVETDAAAIADTSTSPPNFGSVGDTTSSSDAQSTGSADGGASTGDSTTSGQDAQGSADTTGAPLACDASTPCPSNPCADVTCVDGGCQETFYNNGTSCDDDANPCDDTATCQGGVCVDGEALDCSDGDLCTEDSCVPEPCQDGSTGAECHCVHTLQTPCCVVDSDCDDGDLCTGIETCIENDCVPGTPVTCQPGDACSGYESCDPATGACNAVPPIDCDDGVACTIDTCEVSLCLGPETQQECYCSNELSLDCCTEDSHCAGGDACTGGSFCNLGTYACEAYSGVTCDDGNPCTTDSCVDNGPCDASVSDQACYCQFSPTEGCCTDASECDDGQPCTDDSCVDNACQIVDTGTCCISDSDCDDGLYCNGVETCVDGLCAPGATYPCPLLGTGDPCVGYGACDEETQTCYTTEALDCDDDDPCTTDSCVYGLCVGGQGATEEWCYCKYAPIADCD